MDFKYSKFFYMDLYNNDHVINIICNNYGQLSQECIEDFKKISNIEIYEKNKILIREGQTSDKLFFIISGSLRAYYIKKEKEVTDWLAFENDFMCAVNSYLCGIPSPHFLETIETTYCLLISRKDVNDLCIKHHDFERLCRYISNKILLQLQKRIVSLQFETAYEKYENLIIERPDITQRIPLGYLASYLGITIETLSRMRKISSKRIDYLNKKNRNY